VVAPVPINSEYHSILAGHRRVQLPIRGCQQQQALQRVGATHCARIVLTFGSVLMVPGIVFFALLSHSLWVLPEVPRLGAESKLAAEVLSTKAGSHVCPEARWNLSRPATCGARLWASQAALDHLGEEVLASVLGRFSYSAQQLAAEVGGIPTASAGFTWELFDIRIEKIAIASSNFSFVAGRGLQHSVNGIELGISLRYSVRGDGLLAFFFSTGQIVFSLGEGTSFSGLLELSVDPVGRPSLALYKSRVEMDLEANMNEVGTGLVHRVLMQGLFKTFKWILEEPLEHMLQVTLTKAVSEDFADIIAAVDPLIPLKSGCLAIDMAACSVETFADHLEIMVHGAVVDVSRPDLVYPAQAESLPSMPASIQGSMVGVSMNSWLANSVAWTFMQTRLDLSISLNNQLKDLHDYLEWVWPQLDLGLEVYFADSPRILLEEGEIHVEGIIKVDIVDYSSGQNVLASSVPLESWFFMDIQDQKLQMTMNRLVLPGLNLDSGRCNTVLGQRCVFPFKYKGKTYDSCTDVGTSVHMYWCATKVGLDDSYIDGEWGACTASCHVVGNYIIPWLNIHMRSFLEEHVHRNIDFHKPVGDVLVLENTALQVWFDSITVRTDFSLDLMGLLGVRYGPHSANLLLQGRSFASLA